MWWTLIKRNSIKTDDMNCTLECPGMKHPRNRQSVRKKPWSHEEKSAVEKNRFITMMKVQGEKAGISIAMSILGRQSNIMYTIVFR
ncbi:hypothetical protein LSAT2_004117 [Lamellibrachia satsuma]|nr:hypothetical protein LSAT2_004117 [Lamellibrachia satsuma]